MARHDEHTSREIPRTAIAGTTDGRAWEEDEKNGVYVPVQRHGPVIVSVSPGTKQDQNDKKLEKQLSNDTIIRYINNKKKSFNEEEEKKSFNKWTMVHNYLQNGILHEVIGGVQITVVFLIRIYEYGRAVINVPVYFLVLDIWC